jgi:hypothetical protein
MSLIKLFSHTILLQNMWDRQLVQNPIFLQTKFKVVPHTLSSVVRLELFYLFLLDQLHPGLILLKDLQDFTLPFNWNSCDKVRMFINKHSEIHAPSNWCWRDWTNDIWVYSVEYILDFLSIVYSRDGQTFLWAGQMKKVKCQVGQLTFY